MRHSRPAHMHRSRWGELGNSELPPQRTFGCALNPSIQLTNAVSLMNFLTLSRSPISADQTEWGGGGVGVGVGETLPASEGLTLDGRKNIQHDDLGSIVALLCRKLASNLEGSTSWFALSRHPFNTLLCDSKQSLHAARTLPTINGPSAG